MIHATARALRRLAGQPEGDLDTMVAACNGSQLWSGAQFATAFEVDRRVPTCPECLVLWDMALSGVSKERSP